MKLRQTAVFGILVMAGLMAAASAQQPSADWPQWRGSARDAASSFTVPAAWPEQLTKKWEAEVGLGYALPVVIGNRIYQFSRQGEDEVMSALDATNGKVLWSTRYPATFTMNPATAPHLAGPKSTPAFADGRVYSIGMVGTVTAFDAMTGKQLWQKPGGSVQPQFTSHAFSPVVDRGVVFFHTGGHTQGTLTAYDGATGNVKWQWTGDGPGYGSPIIAELGGTRQLITITEGKVVGLDVANGTLLWERPFASSNATNSITPILYGQTVIAGGNGPGGPTVAFAVTKNGAQWATENVWESVDAGLRFANALVVGDTLFGLSSRNMGQYFSVDAKTGKTLWLSEQRQAAYASIVRAGTIIFSLQNDGNLVVFKNGPAPEVVKKYKVAEPATNWSQLAVAGNRLFVKDTTKLALWTVN